MRLASDVLPNACATCSEQFSTDRTGFNPEVAAIVSMQARYVIGPDDIIAYADINVDYRSEPELSAVLLVLQRLQNATS